MKTVLSKEVRIYFRVPEDKTVASASASASASALALYAKRSPSTVAVGVAYDEGARPRARVCVVGHVTDRASGRAR